MVKVVCTRISTLISGSLFEEYLGKFPQNIQQLVLRFKQQKDRSSRLAGKFVLAKALEIHGYGLEVFRHYKFDSYGRPYLQGINGLDFNLSHSGDFAVCAITKKGKIGIDIEKIRDIRVDGFRRIFNDEMFEKIVSSENPKDEFFRLWTIIESVVKAEGTGIAGNTKKIICNGNYVTTPKGLWHVRKIDIADDYSCHVCCSDERNVNISVVSI